MPTETKARRPDISSAERTASGMAAALLALMATRARSRWLSAVYIAAASLLSLRAATGRSRLYRALDVSGAHLSDGGGTDVTASVTVARPRQEVYEFWRDPANFATVMRRAEDVRAIGGGLSHWRVRGPANVPVEWDAEVLDEHPGELISWRSLDGSEIEQAGSVQFKDAPGGRGTEVLLRMRYRVPGGGAGQLGARLASPMTSAMVRQEMGRAKQMLEAGAVATVEGQTHGPRR